MPDHIPQGYAYTKEPDPAPPAEDEDAVLGDAEAYAILQEATWEAHRTKSNIFMAALDRPIPESFVAGQTFPHPFWEESEVDSIKAHYLTFLLSL